MSETNVPTYTEMKTILRQAALRVIHAVDDLPPPLTEKEKREHARTCKMMDAMISQIFGDPVGSA